MSNLLLYQLMPSINQELENAYQIQKKIYGVLVPPTLRQVMTLKELLIKTNLREEIHPDELVGLSKIECKIIITELKKKLKQS